MNTPSVGVWLAPILLLFTTGSCCALTGNYGGGPCPHSRPKPRPAEPERGFVVTLGTPCATKPELWFEYDQHQGPLKASAFEVLRPRLYFVDLGLLRMVDAEGVTVWARTPGTDTYYPYPQALSRRRTTHIVVPCAVP